MCGNVAVAEATRDEAVPAPWTLTHDPLRKWGYADPAWAIREYSCDSWRPSLR